jgi:hypothetical protein
VKKKIRKKKKEKEKHWCLGGGVLGERPLFSQGFGICPNVLEHMI